MTDKVSIFDFLSLLNPDSFHDVGPASIQNGYDKDMLYDEDRRIYEDPIFQEIIYSDFVSPDLPQLSNENILLFVIYAIRKDSKEAYEYLIKHLKPQDIIAFLKSNLSTQKAFDITYLYYQDHYVYIALPTLDEIGRERGFTSPQLNVYDLSDEILIQVILETDPENFQDLAASSRRYANLFRRQDVLKKLGIKYTVPKYSSLREFLKEYYEGKRITKLRPSERLKLLKRRYTDKNKIRIAYNNSMDRILLNIYSVKVNEIAEFMKNIYEIYDYDQFLEYFAELFRRAIYNREDISSELAKIFDSIDISDEKYPLVRSKIYSPIFFNITIGKQLIKDTIRKMSKNRDDFQRFFDGLIYDINILVNEDFSNAREVTNTKYPSMGFFEGYTGLKLLLFYLKDDKNLPQEASRQELLFKIQLIRGYFTPYL